MDMWREQGHHLGYHIEILYIGDRSMCGTKLKSMYHQLPESIITI